MVGSAPIFSVISRFYNGGMSGTWEQVLIGDKPADVFEPANKPRFGLLFLHDHDGKLLRNRPVFTPILEETGVACICPLGDRSWWTDRVCPDFDPRVTAERYVLDSVFPLFAERWQLGPRAVGLLGIGMGGQGVLRLAFKYPQQFPAVAAIAPSIEYYELYGQGTPLDAMYDSKEQCRQDSALLHLHPTRYPPHIYYCISPDDPWFRGCDRLHEKMNALGVPHVADFKTSAGMQAAMRFLVAGLETESRRLL
jgi:S-formylglutathione hydrolase